MSQHRPPKLARKFFEWIAGSAAIDDFVGDLEELFYDDLKLMSPRQATFRYWRRIFSFTFSYALKKRRRNAQPGLYSSSSFSFDMLSNYIKIAWRNLYQHKYFSVLNAFGLAIGMSVSLLMISLFSYVSTYDNFHVNKDKIYTITSSQQEGVEETDFASAPAIVADKLMEEFPGAEKVVRIARTRNIIVKQAKENIPINAYFVDPSFLSVFTFEVLQGNKTSLAKPNQVFITQSAALRLFNSDGVVGKTLEMEDGSLYEISGLLKDHPKNSHLSFEMLISYSTLPEAKLSVSDQWINYQNHYIYVLLREGTSSHELENFLATIASASKSHPVKLSFGVMPLKGIVMGADLRNSIGVKWDVASFIIFGVFALLILLPACFNYTNISIARALRRAKEIGLRKTMGGVRQQIFFQFITETVVITLISLFGALLIFVVIRSEFQSMLVEGSALDLSLTPRMLWLFFVFALATGFAAGILPAIHFSSLNPMEALKNKIKSGGSMRLRKILTVFQFALSFGFILCLVVFSRQYRYSMNFDFGFQKNNIVDVKLQNVSPENFKAAFSALSPVKTISLASGLLGVSASRTWIKNDTRDSIEVSQLFVDDQFISNFGLKFLAGKNFPADPGASERFLIVNEEFLKAYRISNPHDAIGKIYRVDGAELEVIGVLKNFHYAPLNQPIGKFFFRSKADEFTYANLHVVATDPLQLFTTVENAWKQLPTEKKFDGNFFNDELNESYRSYRVLLKIVGFLGLLAMTISLLGMLGMVVYTSETKTKEVGIRKVMGATAGSIAFLLSKEYVQMMAIAIAVAIPITAFILNLILPQIQYYSVSLSLGDVVISMVMLLSLGLVTIASQTYKTAMTNPATTLRSE
jgi:ABC-type antimicrobial peptide transport system permease subunit